MGLFDDIEAAQAEQTNIKCHLCILLGHLDDDERADVQKALNNPNIYGTTIAEVLNGKAKELGLRPLQGPGVQRHRRGAHS